MSAIRLTEQAHAHAPRSTRPRHALAPTLALGIAKPLTMLQFPYPKGTPPSVNRMKGITQMTKATSTKKASSSVTIKAPKLTSAWVSVCSTSAKSESEIIKAIENLSATMVLESRLSVNDQKRFIKGLEDSGKVSSFIKSSHAPALPTWSKLRALHADFRALPIAKQLSTASASYDLLGAGKGEQIKTLDALTTEIARERKAKADKAKGAKGETPKAKAPKNTLADILAYVTALDFVEISEADQDLIAEIHATLEYKMQNA